MTSLVEMPENEDQKRINKIEQIAIEIYLKSGREELAKYLGEVDALRKEERQKRIESQRKYNTEKGKIFVHCPKCGYRFQFINDINGKITGGIGGVSAGAFFGAKIGIAMGPLGAIAGTIPGAILGGIFGKNIGNSFDQPICPNCATKFQVPNNLESDTSELKMPEILGFYKTITVDEIIIKSKTQRKQDTVDYVKGNTDVKLEALRNKLSDYKPLE